MVRSAGLVMLLIMLSRLLGLVREVAIAQIFGMTWETDVFRNAFNLPDLMYFLLVAGGLNAAFIPVFTSYLARGAEDEAWHVASTFFTIGTGSLLFMAVTGSLFSPYLTPLVGYGFVGPQRDLLIDLMRILFGAVFFTALAGLGMGVHRSYKSFVVPMVGPIVYNLCIILGAYMLAGTLGIYALAVGTCVGAVGNALVQFPFVWRKSAGRLRLRADVKHPGFRQILHLMGPSVIALSIFQVSFTITANIASGLAEGSASALRIGQQLIQLPLGIFAMGMGTVLLPTLSELAARQNFKEFRTTFTLGLRAVLYVIIPASVGLAVLAEPIIRLLFQSGQFTAENTGMAAVAVRYYALGVFAQATSQILMQVFFALQATTILVRVSVLSLLANTGLALLLLEVTPFEHGALALAWSLTAILNMLAYLWALRNRIGELHISPVLRASLLSVLAATIMGAGALWTARFLESLVDISSIGGRTVQVACGVVVGVVIYLGLTLILRMEEVQFVRDLIRRRQKTPSPTSPVD